MKSILLVLSACALMAFVPAEVTERLNVSGPLELNNTTFNLAWSDHPRDNYYIQEYLPEGETVDDFNQMLTLHLFVGETTVEQGIGQKMRELDERKETDPVCNYAIMNNPDKTEYMIDFLLGESEGGATTVVEFNVYRYKRVQVAKKKEGLLVYAYSKRAYMEDVTEFMQGLKEARTTYLNQVIEADMPEIKIK